MDNTFYFEKFYPLQDGVLRVITDAGTGFYLTGGTAASRAYLHHRFSDDLDLFVNDDERFGLWTDRIIQALLGTAGISLAVDRRDERFVRTLVTRDDLSLRIEMVNDTPAHVGVVTLHETLGRLDSAENILANKVTALIDRDEPKDLADVWAFCSKMSLSLNSAIESAHGKAAGVFPPDLARILCSGNEKHWEAVQWIDAPPVETFLGDLRKLGESLIL